MSLLYGSSIFITSFVLGIFLATGFSIKITKLVLEDFFIDIYQNFYKISLNLIHGIKPDVHEAYL